VKIGVVLSLGAIAALLLPGARLRAQEQWSGSGSAASIPSAALIQPDQLNRLLHAQGAEKPMVLQVGSRIMYAEAHIPAAEYAGPASQPDGLKRLRDRVAPLHRKTPIVIYCGCCPWDRCPNIAPAYRLLHDMGFSRLSVLYLADNFGTDWVSKGFPVEQGQ